MKYEGVVFGGGESKYEGGSYGLTVLPLSCHIKVRLAM